MQDIKLPLVLAGPIIRRADKSAVYIWFAFKDKIDAVKGVIFKPNQPSNILGRGNVDTLRLGENLHIALLKIIPSKEEFPEDQILHYNVFFGDQSLLDTKFINEIVYSPFEYPSFFLQSPNTPLNLLFGSCRKIHGVGEDALAEGDTVMSEVFQDYQKRPSALFLGGDQIYADDISSVIFPTVSQLGKQLMGKKEYFPPRLESEEYKFGSRGLIIKEILQKIGHFADNHIVGFGEYAALYCLSWNPDLWNQNIFEEAYTNSTNRRFFQCEGEELTDEVVLKREERHIKEITLVKNFYKGLKQVRRLLANVPTYMLFDDHEITDDWNISHSWKTKMENNLFGSRILCNGMASYWAFQGWGNNPEQFNEEYLSKILDYTNQKIIEENTSTYDLNKFYLFLTQGVDWDYLAPTYPKALFLDTRTNRYFEYRNDKEGFIIIDKMKDLIAKGTNKAIDFALKLVNNLVAGSVGEFIDNTPPQLISEDHLSFLNKNFKKDLYQQSFILVTATPVFGIQRFEDLLRLGNNLLSMYKWDNESWAANYNGYLNLLKFLIEDIQPLKCIILSGDVHYGFMHKNEVILDEDNNIRKKFIQITCSSFKNQSTDLTKKKKDLLEILEVNTSNNKRFKEMEWKESRAYFDFPDDNGSSKILAKTNIGLLSHRDGKVKFRFEMPDSSSTNI